MFILIFFFLHLRQFGLRQLCLSCAVVAHTRKINNSCRSRLCPCDAIEQNGSTNILDGAFFCVPSLINLSPPLRTVQGMYNVYRPDLTLAAEAGGRGIAGIACVVALRK